jgi:hypothetical protein
MTLGRVLTTIMPWKRDDYEGMELEGSELIPYY